MSTRWNAPRRTLNERSAREFQVTVWQLHLRQRIDIVLIGGVIAALLILVFIWFAAVQYGKIRGLFDPPVVRPLADERILRNVRDNATINPFLDATYHNTDGRIYISQEGGVIHRYDPQTRLWSTETPFKGNVGLNPDFIFLRSGCGNDPQAEISLICPDPDSLWGVTASGGLARRQEGNWEILIGDTSFIGASGRPVDHKQLTSAAISTDQRWLVLGTTDEGIGIYDTQQGSWRHLPQEFFASLPALQIDRVVYWADRFWLGTPDGLAGIMINTRSQSVLPVDGMTGAILDIDVDESMWILRKHLCADERTDDCLWMGKFTRPDSPPQVFMDEQHRFPDLRLSELSFAQQWAGYLVVAGEPGIYLYDTEKHDWQKISDQKIQITLSLPGKNGFYFTYDGGAGLTQQINPRDIVEWSLPGEQITQIFFAGPDTMALTRQGNLYTLSESGEVIPVHKVTKTNFDPELFTDAVATGDTVLFVGSEGAVIHDVLTRHYEDVPKNQLPEWMIDSDTQLVGVGTDIYAVTKSNDRQALIYHLDGNEINDSADLQNQSHDAQPQIVPGPVIQIWPWATTGIGLIGGDGSLYRITRDKVDRLTGAAVNEMNNLPMLDVIERGNDFIVSTRQGLRTYDLNNRAWGEFIPPPADRRAEELTLWNGQLLMRTDASRLVRQSSTNPVLIGDPEGFHISDDGLSDAVLQGNLLFLAGDGVAEVYDMELRRIINRWDPPTDGALTIESIINDVPLTLGDQRTFLGEQEIDSIAGAVVSVSAGNGRIWTIRRSGQERYLKSYALSSPSVANASCLFRTPYARGVNQIFDARDLPNDLIAVATNAGLFFYRAEARSWYTTSINKSLINPRVYVINNHLILTYGAPGAKTVTTVQLSSIPTPHSCSTDIVQLSDETTVVESVTVDESGKKMAWLDRSNRVISWNNSNQQVILATPGGGPRPESLRRVYQRPSDLLFTTDNSLWRYNLTLRSWHQIALQGIPSDTAIADIDISAEGQQQILLVRMENGIHLLGTFELTSGHIVLNTIHTPNTETFNARADELLDIQERNDGLWTFVLKDEIKYLDPATRSWKGSAQLGEPDPSLIYQEANGRGVAVGENGQTWWVAQSTTPGPTRFARYSLRSEEQTALDERGQIWSLDANGRLLRCTASTNREYSCAQHGSETFWLDQITVNAVFTWQSLHIFETPNGMRIYDPVRRGEVEIPSLAQGFTGFIQVRETPDRRLWLWNGVDLLILSYSNSALNAQKIEAVDKLVFGQTMTPWIRQLSGWRFWKNGEFASSSQLEDMTLFIGDDSVPSGVDSTNVPYFWQQERFRTNTLSLPEEIAPSSIKGLWRTPLGNWWVRIGNNEVAYVVNATCPPPNIISGQIPTSITTTVPITPTTPSPTPTPVPPIPCMVTTSRLTLPEGTDLPLPDHIVSSQITDETLDLNFQEGEKWRFNRAASNADNQVSMQIDRSIVLAGTIRNQWPSQQAYFRKLGSGRWAYDPITEIKLEANGALIASRPLTPEQLAERGSLTFSLPQALDAGWLHWNRTNRQFQIATTTGNRTFSAAQFIIGNALIFEPVSALLAEGVSRLVVANQYGIWRYGSSSLRLNDSAITFQPITIDLPIAASHGRFMAANGDIVLGDRSVQPRAHSQSTTFGDVILNENLRSRGIRGTYKIGNTNPSVFDPVGFIWDSGRRSVAYFGNVLYILDDAGIHPTNSFVGHDSGPTTVSLNETMLMSEEGGSLHLYDQELYYRRDRNNWSSSVRDPASTRILLDNAIWRWELNDNVFAIALYGVRHDFSHRSTQSGYTFSTDHVQAAASFDGQVFILTDSFLEVSDDIDEVQKMKANRYAPQPSDKFDPIAYVGTYRLFRTHGSSISYWDERTDQFVDIGVGQNPYTLRGLISTARLRLTLTQGKILKEIRLDNIVGGSSWAAFSFQKGHFPFDVVTTVASYLDKLYIGTAAGLLTFSGSSAMHLDNASNFFDMRGTNRDEPTPVVRMGIPVNSPNQFVVISENTCYQLQATGPFSLCSPRQPLDRVLRVSSPFWQWSRLDDNRIEGSYRDGTGRVTNMAVQISQGRFPHDTLRQGSVCQNEMVTLWQADWITSSNATTISLGGQSRHYDSRTSIPRRLICVGKMISLAGVELRPALYLENSQNLFARWETATWKSIENPEERKGLKEYADHPPIYERARLRLGRPTKEQPFVFKQRSLDNQWHELSWQLGQLEIDTWSAALWHDNTHLWLATAAGLVPFAKSPAKDQITIAPDNLHVVREPIIDNKLCTITDMMLIGTDTMVRCSFDSEKIYTGVLDDESDMKVFLKVSDDPFAETILVNKLDAGYWAWQRKRKVGGEPGVLVAQLGSEEIQLSGGRFPFDSINSMALHWTDKMDIVSDGGGWYQTGRGSFAIAEITRPDHNIVDPTTILHVGRTSTANTAQLCLQTGDDYILISLQNDLQTSERCAEYLAQDSLWTYNYDYVDNTVVILAQRTIGGVGYRILNSGRFTDDWVIGPPITGNDSSGIVYLLPTRAGVLEYNPSLQPQRIHVGSFPGLPDNSVPRALFMTDSDGAIYAGNTQFHYLNSQRDTVASLPAWPETNIASPPNSLSNGPLNTLYLRWHEQNNHHYLLVSKERGSTASLSTILVDLSNLDRYTGKLSTNPSLSPWMFLTIPDSTLIFSFNQNETSIDIPGIGNDVVAVVPVFGRAFLIQKNELYEINPDRIIAQ